MGLKKSINVDQNQTVLHNSNSTGGNHNALFFSYTLFNC